MAAKGPSSAEIGSGPRLEDTTVLLVDDHADLSDNVAQILRAQGAKVIVAPHAAAALDLQEGIDSVALVDINLPDATGLSLLPKLKNREDAIVEVVLMTGHASIEDAIAALQVGAYDFVVKPFDLDHLIASVSRAARQVRSARKAAKLHAALLDSEANLRGLVDTVQAMLLELDAEGLVLGSNRAVSDALGITRQQVRGKNLFEDLIVPQDKAAMRGYFEQLLRKPSAAPRHCEARLVGPGAGPEHRRRVHWHLAQVQLESSEQRIYASGIDVTELRALERKQRIHEKLAAVGTLSAGLAHEIRNPLNAMSLQMQLLRRRLGPCAAQADIESPLSVMNSEIQRLSHLVDDFLRFARPSELLASPADLSALVAQVVGLAQLEAKERGVHLRCAPGQEACPAQVDGEKLRQVLFNLVANAVDASSEGQTVELCVGTESEIVYVEVADQGRGIPEAELPRIFEPFFSTKAHGTGLGMAISHRLVDLHGGEILIDSEPGKGTKVRVNLPRRPPQSPPFAAGP